MVVDSVGDYVVEFVLLVTIHLHPDLLIQSD